jgi:hypothetical protein
VPKLWNSRKKWTGVVNHRKNKRYGRRRSILMKSMSSDLGDFRNNGTFGFDSFAAFCGNQLLCATHPVFPDDNTKDVI